MATMMLKPKALEEVLSQALGDGVTTSVLLNPDGSVVACAPAGQGQITSAKQTAVLSSNIWYAFDKLGTRLSRGSPVAAPSTSPMSPSDVPGPAFSVGELGVLLITDEKGGKVGLARTGGKMVVAIEATSEASLGALKSKLLGLADYLEVPLNQVNR